MLAENINRIAKEKGITMYKIAKDADLSVSYVWDICKGNRENPSINVMKKIAKVLEVTVDKLIN